MLNRYTIIRGFRTHAEASKKLEEFLNNGVLEEKRDVPKVLPRTYAVFNEHGNASQRTEFVIDILRQSYEHGKEARRLL